MNQHLKFSLCKPRFPAFIVFPISVVTFFQVLRINHLASSLNPFFHLIQHISKSFHFQLLPQVSSQNTPLSSHLKISHIVSWLLSCYPAAKKTLQVRSGHPSAQSSPVAFLRDLVSFPVHLLLYLSFLLPSRVQQTGQLGPRTRQAHSASATLAQNALPPESHLSSLLLAYLIISQRLSQKTAVLSAPYCLFYIPVALRVGTCQYQTRRQ